MAADTDAVSADPICGCPITAADRAHDRRLLLANLHAVEADLAKTTIARHPVWAARLRVWRDELRKQLEEVSSCSHDSSET